MCKDKYLLAIKSVKFYEGSIYIFYNIVWWSFKILFLESELNIYGYKSNIYGYKLNIYGYKLNIYGYKCWGNLISLML